VKAEDVRWLAVFWAKALAIAALALILAGALDLLVRWAPWLKWVGAGAFGFLLLNCVILYLRDEARAPNH